MKTKIKLFFQELTLPVLLSWFLMTILVDIIVIPTVFRNISSIQEAGKIGMTVFGRFNIMEVFFAIIVLAGVVVHKKRSGFKIGLSAFLFCHVLNYAFFMTPKITNTTKLIHQTATSDPQFAVLQSQHAFYHTLYRYLDTTKLVLLLVFIALVIFQNIKLREKELQ